MKKIIFFLICSFVINLYSNAQDINIHNVVLTPNIENTIKLNLNPKNKYAINEIDAIPLTLVWDNENNKIVFLFKGNNNESNNQVWFAHSKNYIKKYKRQNIQTWYSNNVKKDKTIEKFWESSTLTHNYQNNSKKLEFSNLSLGNDSKQEFVFDINEKESDSCNIKLKLYVVSIKPKNIFTRDKNKKFEYLSESKISIALKLPNPCEDQEFVKLINDINSKTDSIDKIIEETKSLITDKNCKQKIETKKQEVKSLYLETIDNKYSDCEDIASAIENNKNAYKEFELINCKGTTEPKTQSCAHSIEKTKKLLENTNAELFEISKKIARAKVNGDNLNSYKSLYLNTKGKIQNNTCSTCLNNNYGLYNTYLEWCKNIDELLK